MHIIAEKADGALRDALSIFDRMATYGGGQITYDQVLVNLSILDYEFYFRIVDAAIQNDQRQLLLIFNEILDKGFDGHLFLNGLAAHLRDLLVSSDQSTQMLLERGEDIKIRYVSQASILSFERILESLDVLSKADADYRKSSNSRLLVELSLLKLADCLSGEKKKPSH